MVIYADNLRADADEEEFLKYQEENISFVYCENEEVLNCLNVNYSSCKDNIKSGNIKCTSTKLLEYFSPGLEDFRKYSSEIKIEYDNYLWCMSDNFMGKLNISGSTFKICEPLMVKVIEERRRKDNKESVLRNQNEQ